MSSSHALKWVVIWFLLAMATAGGVFYFAGRQHGIEFLTCYLIEWTLSIDNLFVFLMIFRAFGVDDHRQLRALEWGIIGAIVILIVFIMLGLALVSLFEPVLYVFGALLIYSAVKMALEKRDQAVDVSHNVLVRWAQKAFRITPGFVGDRFFVRDLQGGLMATPMLLVVLVIESSDIMFAIDSIPAAFAITRQPLIIFVANMLAILGLRSLYFLLAHADRSFRYLRLGVSFILAFVGFKMIVEKVFHVNVYLSLGVVIGTLAISVLASMIPEKAKSS